MEGKEREGNRRASLPGRSILISDWTRCVRNLHAVFPRTARSRAPCGFFARRCATAQRHSFCVHLSNARRKRPLEWRSKAPSSIFSPSLRHRYQSRSRVLRRQKQICLPWRSPTRLQKSKPKKHRNRKKQRPAVLHRRTSTNLQNWDSTSCLVTRLQHLNKSESALIKKNGDRVIPENTFPKISRRELP